jgi:hypothetical protein
MYQNTNLQNYLEQSSSVNLQSLVLAEWNMNFSDNIYTLGNYRYRPATLTATEANFGTVAASWDFSDTLSAYTGATNSNIIVNVGINLDTLDPLTNSVLNQTEKMLYSLTDTISRFRPRSGINKVRFLGNNYINYANANMHKQPRFYLSSKDDKFKYWNSYRVESGSFGGVERGIALTATGNGDYWIDDTAPFVVYKDYVPANRLVVKMQTGVGDTNYGPYKKSNNTSFNDPFYEDPTNTGNLVNQKTPARWKVQVLIGTTWTTVQTFSLNQTRTNGKRVIGSDGYVELAYGITNAPTKYGPSNNLDLNVRLLGNYPSVNALPIDGGIGDAYLVADPTKTTAGTIYVWNGTDWTTKSFTPVYGWYLNEEGQTLSTSKLTTLTSPDFYGSATTTLTPTYREFQFIKGIRIVVDTMTQYRSSFDLIEMSPRLVADLSDKTINYSIEKIASDIGNSGIPVGQLLASTGSISIFDYDQSFNEYNDLTTDGTNITGSLISNITSKNLQFKFYEHIIDDRSYPTMYDYYVPIKTMYVDGFPQINTSDRTATLTLRDLLFYFESITAPSILLRNVPLSFAIATLLDNIGFSNYKFLRNTGESEDKIPYFFIAPDTNVAEVLNDLAQSTQTSMFFDEDNNFVTMSKNYIMPPTAANGGRDAVITLYGTKDFASSNLSGGTGAIKNYYDPYNASTKILANIESLEAEDSIIYNGGKITYNNKYIQKSTSTIKEQSMLNKDRAYKYKPVLLWEVAGTESLRPENDEVGNQSSYSLSALVLNSNLSNNPPTISGGILINNTMDFGQSIYWLTRYKGFFYSNGEIIQYDAVQYSVTGQSSPVWIQSTSEYQQYFAQLPFGGKMFPTGFVRIYAEVSNNVVTKHGRAQFGTTITNHTVLDSTNSWLNPINHRTFRMQSQWLFQKGQYGQTTYEIKGVNATSPTATLNVSDTTGLVEGLYFYPYTSVVVPLQTPTFSSGNMTITTSTAHNLQLGNTIRIKNVLPTEYRGTYVVVNIPSTTSFTVKNINSAAGNITTAGSVSVKYNDLGNSAIPEGTKIKSINAAANQITLTKEITSTLTNATIYATSDLIEPLGTISYSIGDSISFMLDKPIVSGTTKDFFDSSSYTELDTTSTMDKNKPNGTIKSSALVISGPHDFNPLLIDAITAYNGTTKTYTIGNNHQFKVGDKVLVSNLTSGNGTFKVTATTSSTITTDNTSTISISNETGKIEKFLQKSNNAISYVYKNYNTECPTAYSFGTRMRIVGQPLPTNENINAAKQTPIGGEILNSYKNSSGTYDVSGTGGGIAINIDPTVNKNIGYYFEIVALSNESIIEKTDKDTQVTSIPNVFFYKILKGANTKEAVPVVLWSGNAPILVDDGQFVGMSKSMSTKTPTVYDLLVETEELSSNAGAYRRKFNLYLNGKLIATVKDNDAIPLNANNKNIALFTRGKGICFFEHVFAIGDNSAKPNSPINKKSAFIDNKLDNANYRKYLINPAILQTYLQEVGSSQQPKYSLYFEEFGTIMRECAYFNIRYDKAYPALYSQISPTLNESQGYVISNFRSNPYGAEFMVFNASDFALNLDESTGNFLRIQGITFTQQSQHDLTVDEYFKQNSQLNNYENYSNLNNKYISIQNSRNTYGKKDFTLSGNYIQNFDTANNLMKWMVDKVMTPKKSVCVTVFANPMIQLGDIVQIDYEIDNVLQNSTGRFIVYHITYDRGSDGPEMKLYLSEVV